MKALKSARTLAASLGVLAIGALAASPAMAFDNLEWNWQKDIKQKEDIDVKINLDVDITGMVEVEKLQIFLGDAEAESLVHNIYNDPIRTTQTTTPPGGGNPPPKPPKPHMYGKDDNKGPKGPSCQNVRGGKDCGGHDPEPPKPVTVTLPLNAVTQLPILVSTASAIGNNQSITSDVPIFLHDGQFVADVKEDYRPGGNCDSRKGRCDSPKPAFSPDALASASSGGGFGSNGQYNPGPQGNLHTLIAGLFGLGAVTGELKHANIEATSKVWDVRNVSVDSSATAVANNISVTLASDTNGVPSTSSGSKSKGGNCGPNNGRGSSNCHDDNGDVGGSVGNHVVIADITQFALANVTATSHVSNVKASGYDNMRQLTTSTLTTKEGDPGATINVPTPWVSSVATAVGNNVSINVGRDLTPTAAP